MAKQSSTTGRLLKAEDYLTRAQAEILVLCSDPEIIGRLRGCSTTVGLAIDKIRDALEHFQAMQKAEKAEGRR